jgi:hypothetical protein
VSKKKKVNRMDQALLETTRDFHRGGLASAAQLEKITVRVLGTQASKNTVSSAPCRRMSKR